jgi:hypothetical protein
MPRVYEIDPTKRVAFDERFRDDAARVMEFYDFRILARWESGTDGRTEFIYLRDWPDQEPTDSGSPVVAWANDAGLVGHDDGLNAVTQAEHVEDAGDVDLGGGLADIEGACGLAVGQSFGDELEYLELARGEPRKLCGRGAATGSVHAARRTVSTLEAPTQTGSGCCSGRVAMVVGRLSGWRVSWR